MKNKKMLIVALVFGLISSFAFAQTTRDGVDLFALQNADENAITIEQAIDLALENNSSIQIAQKSAQIYDQQVKQYWSYVYPQITLSGSYTRTIHPQEVLTSMGKFRMGLDNATSGTAEATLLLWKGGAVSAGIRMGEYHSQSGYLQLAETQNLIKDNVYTLCFGIILTLVYEYTGSGLLIIVFHMLYNFISLFCNPSILYTIISYKIGYFSLSALSVKSSKAYIK